MYRAGHSRGISVAGSPLGNASAEPNTNRLTIGSMVLVSK
jgi:hypothetical protein